MQCKNCLVSPQKTIDYLFYFLKDPKLASRLYSSLPAYETWKPDVRSALRPWDEIRPASVLARAVVGMKSWLFYHSSNMWLLAYHTKLLQPFTGAPLRQISGARTCRAFSLPKHYSQGWCAFWLLKREFQSNSLYSPMHWNCEKAWSHFTLVLNNKKGSSFYRISNSTEW